MADPNRFPWRVRDDVKIKSEWVFIVDADGWIIGAIYMLSHAENLAWAQKIVDLVNEAYASPSDGAAAEGATTTAVSAVREHPDYGSMGIFAGYGECDDEPDPPMTPRAFDAIADAPDTNDA